MSLRSFVRRRPSAPLVVSFVALFVALGGAGWAALRIPANSVGTAQLQNFSVSNTKLRANSVGAAKLSPGAVGAKQVNSSQVQLRVTGPCTAGAIQSIALQGNVTCTQTLPNEYGGTSSQAVSLGSTSTPVASLSLPSSHAGSYLVFANVHVAAVDAGVGAQSLDVTCSLAVGTGTGAKGDFSADLGGGFATAQSGTIPLELPVVISGSSQPVGVSCSEASPPGPAPSVSVTATINAIQTAANS
jgi:hypothetical protein